MERFNIRIRQGRGTREESKGGHEHMEGRGDGNEEADKGGKEEEGQES